MGCNSTKMKAKMETKNAPEIRRKTPTNSEQPVNADEIPNFSEKLDRKEESYPPKQKAAKKESYEDDCDLEMDDDPVIGEAISGRLKYTAPTKKMNFEDRNDPLPLHDNAYYSSTGAYNRARTQNKGTTPEFEEKYERASSYPAGPEDKNTLLEKIKLYQAAAEVETNDATCNLMCYQELITLFAIVGKLCVHKQLQIYYIIEEIESRSAFLYYSESHTDEHKNLIREGVSMNSRLRLILNNETSESKTDLFEQVY